MKKLGLIKDKNIHDLYIHAFKNAAKEYITKYDIDSTVDGIPFIKKIVTYGIKAVNSKPKAEYITEKSAKDDFEFVDTIEALMGALTPGEFTSLFPIDKRFNGDKYEIKDYFYTRDYMDKLDQDKPIGTDKIPDLLWEYMNREITFFNIAAVGCVDNFRKLNGQPTCMEAFCQESGIRTYTMYEDGKGQEFMVDNETGKCKPIKTTPGYLKMKMGGKING